MNFNIFEKENPINLSLDVMIIVIDDVQLEFQCFFFNSAFLVKRNHNKSLPVMMSTNDM